MPTTRADLADPTTLAALGDLEIVARWIVDGFLSGLHRSPRRGFSQEFAEHRAYQPGDDLRYLDWRIAARADRWVVKQFEEETNLRAALVLDVSRSMAWSGRPDRLTKLAYARRLVAALALLLRRQRDAVGLVLVDAAVRGAVPPGAHRDQWRRVVTALAAIPDAGPPDSPPASAPAAGLERAGRLVPRAGLVILVSDLLVDQPPVLDALAALRGAGHDVTIVQVLDPAERDLSLLDGEGLLEDPESGAQAPAPTSDGRAAYRTAVDGALAGWQRECDRLGVRYALATTDAPFATALRAAFDARAAAL